MTNQDHREAFVENAANNFLRFRVHGGSKGMTKTLSERKREQILSQCAAAGMPAEAMAGIDFNVKLFGSKHKEFYQACKAPTALLRNTVYRESFALAPHAEGRSGQADRMVLAIELSKKWPRWEALRDSARASFESFMPYFKQYCEIGRREADQYFQQFGVTISDELIYPTEAEFRAAFHCDLEDPTALEAGDLSRFGAAIPADMAARVSANSIGTLADKLDGAKAVLVESVQKYLNRLTDQLAPGKKVYDTLLEDGLHWAAMCESFASSYDGDTFLMASAKQIRTICNVPDAQIWRDDEGKREASRNAALGLSKKVKQSQRKVQPVQPSAVANVGMVGRLINK
jgi:hypothetical protein